MPLLTRTILTGKAAKKSAVSASGIPMVIFMIYGSIHHGALFFLRYRLGGFVMALLVLVIGCPGAGKQSAAF
jgi:hypothetical protein